jgi:hypothetical protein
MSVGTEVQKIEWDLQERYGKGFEGGIDIYTDGTFEGWVWRGADLHVSGFVASTAAAVAWIEEMVAAEGAKQ